MKTGQTIEITIRSIANGYLMSARLSEGYSSARTGETYYADIGEVEDELPNLLAETTKLTISDDDGEVTF